MKKINLFIIGTHKSGTTTLVKLLNTIDGVYLPEEEMHYFERDYVEQRIKNAKFVNKRFLRRKNITFENYIANYEGKGDYYLLGDKTPSYLYSKTAASEIFNYNPDARIVVIFREPFSFIRSLHSQNVYNLIEPDKDFARAIATNIKDRIERLPRESLAELHMLDYMQRVDYAGQLRSFLNYFDHSQIHVMLFEDIKNDFIGTIKSLYHFLGLESEIVREIKANKNKELKYPSLRKLIRLISSFGVQDKILSKSTITRLKSTYNRLFLSYSDRKEISPLIAKKFKRLFNTNVRDLIDLLREYNLMKDAHRLTEVWGYQNLESNDENEI